MLRKNHKDSLQSGSGELSLCKADFYTNSMTSLHLYTLPLVFMASKDIVSSLLSRRCCLSSFLISLCHAWIPVAQQTAHAQRKHKSTGEHMQEITITMDF